MRSKTVQNRMLLDSKLVKKVGVYCQVNEDYEEDTNYLKAEVVSEENDLPLIKIVKTIKEKTY